MNLRRRTRKTAPFQVRIDVIQVPLLDEQIVHFESFDPAAALGLRTIFDPLILVA